MFTNTAKGEIGGKTIGWLKNIDLVRIETITKSKKEKENIIIPTDRVIGLLDEETKLKPLPRRLPMIVKPKTWKRIKSEEGSKEILGGYLLNDEKYVRPLLIPKFHFGKPTLIKDENLVYYLVNNVNSVGYKVNKDVMEFIITYGSKYDLIINSAYTHPLRNKSKLTKAEHVELTSFLSQKDLQESILTITELYSTKHEFFIPTNLDFRGRLYCVSEYLNYQSTELAKSLLLFSKGEKLYKSDKESINYLKAYGANCYGNKLDKMS
jgi:DNA-directed RNA polymerase